MSIVQEKNAAQMFLQQELVTWHYRNGGKQIPVAGVVIRQEPDSVLIKARIQDTFTELHVNPEELAKR